MPTVYLAGGMRSNWRKRVRNKSQGLDFISPVDKEVDYEMSAEEYGVWDLHYLREVNIVFGYMERTNPSGIGLACELGYAYGKDTTVVLVLEDESKHFKDRYLQFMEKVSDVRFSSLEDGIRFLSTFERN